MPVEQRVVSPVIVPQDDCLFCYPQKAAPSKPFTTWAAGWGGETRMENPAKIPLFKGKYVTAFADSLPISEDGQHILVVDNDHTIAYGQDFKSREKAEEVAWLTARLTEESGEPVMIAEHGGGLDSAQSDKPSIQSIKHSHLHLKWGKDPFGRDLIRYMTDQLTQQGWHVKRVDVVDGNPVNTIKKAYVDHPYLFFSFGNDGIIVIDEQERMKSMTTQSLMSAFYSGGVPMRWKEMETKSALAKEGTRRIMHLLNKCSYQNGILIPR